MPSSLSALEAIAHRLGPCIMSQKCCTNHKLQLSIRSAQHSTAARDKVIMHTCVLDNNIGCAVVQVALNPSALAADDSGHAASVQATGGNKVKLQKGAAAFKDVKVTAEEAGDYVLRIASGNRKVTVQLWQLNAFWDCQQRA